MKKKIKFTEEYAKDREDMRFNRQMSVDDENKYIIVDKPKKKRIDLGEFPPCGHK